MPPVRSNNEDAVLDVFIRLQEEDPVFFNKLIDKAKKFKTQAGGKIDLSSEEQLVKVLGLAEAQAKKVALAFKSVGAEPIAKSSLTFLIRDLDKLKAELDKFDKKTSSQRTKIIQDSLKLTGVDKLENGLATIARRFGVNISQALDQAAGRSLKTIAEEIKKLKNELRTTTDVGTREGLNKELAKLREEKRKATSTPKENVETAAKGAFADERFLKSVEERNKKIIEQAGAVGQLTTNIASLISQLKSLNVEEDVDGSQRKKIIQLLENQRKAIKELTLSELDLRRARATDSGKEVDVTEFEKATKRKIAIQDSAFKKLKDQIKDLQAFSANIPITGDFDKDRKSIDEFQIKLRNLQNAYKSLSLTTEELVERDKKLITQQERQKILFGEAGALANQLAKKNMELQASTDPAKTAALKEEVGKLNQKYREALGIEDQVNSSILRETRNRGLQAKEIGKSIATLEQEKTQLDLSNKKLKERIESLKRLEVASNQAGEQFVLADELKELIRQEDAAIIKTKKLEQQIISLKNFDTKKGTGILGFNPQDLQKVDDQIEKVKNKLVTLATTTGRETDEFKKQEKLLNELLASRAKLIDLSNREVTIAGKITQLQRDRQVLEARLANSTDVKQSQILSNKIQEITSEIKKLKLGIDQTEAGFVDLGRAGNLTFAQKIASALGITRAGFEKLIGRGAEFGIGLKDIALIAEFAIGNILSNLLSNAASKLVQLGKDAIQSSKEVAQFTREQTQAAKITGASLENINALSAGFKALAFSGTRADIKDVVESFNQLSQKVRDAANNSEVAQQSFKTLGVEIKDKTTGALKNVNEITEQLDKNFSRLPASLRKFASLGGVLGEESARQVGVVIGRLGEFKKLAEEAGTTVTEKLQKNTEGFNQSLLVLNAYLEGVKILIAQSVLPILQSLNEEFLEVIKELKATGRLTDLTLALENIGELLGGLVSFFIRLTPLVINTTEALGFLAATLNDIGFAIEAYASSLDEIVVVSKKPIVGDAFEGQSKQIRKIQIETSEVIARSNKANQESFKKTGEAVEGLIAILKDFGKVEERNIQLLAIQTKFEEARIKLLNETGTKLAALQVPGAKKQIDVLGDRSSVSDLERFKLEGKLAQDSADEQIRINQELLDKLLAAKARATKALADLDRVSGDNEADLARRRVEFQQTTGKIIEAVDKETKDKLKSEADKFFAIRNEQQEKADEFLLNKIREFRAANPLTNADTAEALVKESLKYNEQYQAIFVKLSEARDNLVSSTSEVLASQSKLTTEQKKQIKELTEAEADAQFLRTVGAEGTRKAILDGDIKAGELQARIVGDQVGKVTSANDQKVKSAKKTVELIDQVNSRELNLFQAKEDLKFSLLQAAAERQASFNINTLKDIDKAFNSLNDESKKALENLDADIKDIDFTTGLIGGAEQVKSRLIQIYDDTGKAIIVSSQTAASETTDAFTNSAFERSDAEKNVITDIKTGYTAIVGASKQAAEKQKTDFSRAVTSQGVDIEKLEQISTKSQQKRLEAEIKGLRAKQEANKKDPAFAAQIEQQITTLKIKALEFRFSEEERLRQASQRKQQTALDVEAAKIEQTRQKVNRTLIEKIEKGLTIIEAVRAARKELVRQNEEDIKQQETRINNLRNEKGFVEENNIAFITAQTELNKLLNTQKDLQDLIAGKITEEEFLKRQGLDLGDLATKQLGDQLKLEKDKTEEIKKQLAAEGKRINIAGGVSDATPSVSDVKLPKLFVASTVKLDFSTAENREKARKFAEDLLNDAMVFFNKGFTEIAADYEARAGDLLTKINVAIIAEQNKLFEENQKIQLEKNKQFTQSLLDIIKNAQEQNEENERQHNEALQGIQESRLQAAQENADAVADAEASAGKQIDDLEEDFAKRSKERADKKLEEDKARIVELKRIKDEAIRQDADKNLELQSGFISEEAELIAKIDEARKGVANGVTQKDRDEAQKDLDNLNKQLVKLRQEEERRQKRAEDKAKRLAEIQAKADVIAQTDPQQAKEFLDAEKQALDDEFDLREEFETAKARLEELGNKDAIMRLEDLYKQRIAIIKARAMDETKAADDARIMREAAAKAEADKEKTDLEARRQAIKEALAKQLQDLADALRDRFEELDKELQDESDRYGEAYGQIRDMVIEALKAIGVEIDDTSTSFEDFLDLITDKSVTAEEKLAKISGTLKSIKDVLGLIAQIGVGSGGGTGDGTTGGTGGQSGQTGGSGGVLGGGGGSGGGPFQGSGGGGGGGVVGNGLPGSGSAGGTGSTGSGDGTTPQTPKEQDAFVRKRLLAAFLADKKGNRTFSAISGNLIKLRSQSLISNQQDNFLFGRAKQSATADEFDNSIIFAINGGSNPYARLKSNISDPKRRFLYLYSQWRKGLITKDGWGSGLLEMSNSAAGLIQGETYSLLLSLLQKTPEGGPKDEKEFFKNVNDIFDGKFTTLAQAGKGAQSSGGVSSSVGDGSLVISSETISSSGSLSPAKDEIADTTGDKRNALKLDEPPLSGGTVKEEGINVDVPALPGIVKDNEPPKGLALTGEPEEDLNQLYGSYADSLDVGLGFESGLTATDDYRSAAVQYVQGLTGQGLLNQEEGERTLTFFSSGQAGSPLERKTRFKQYLANLLKGRKVNKAGKIVTSSTPALSSSTSTVNSVGSSNDKQISSPSLTNDGSDIDQSKISSNTGSPSVSKVSFDGTDSIQSGLVDPFSVSSADILPSVSTDSSKFAQVAAINETTQQVNSTPKNISLSMPINTLITVDPNERAKLKKEIKQDLDDTIRKVVGGGRR